MQTITETKTGAQILIQTLKHIGTDSIFGYPGGVILKVYDELSKQKDIKHYLVRHEQAACHAAEGYARVSGKCGVVIVTSGPGATNLVTGLANAFLDGTPLIAITGQVSKELLHTNAYQEVDIIDITKSCTKKNFQVTNINDLQSTIIKAHNIAMSGRKGPVLIDITKNVFSETTEFDENLEINNFSEHIYKNDIIKAVSLIKESYKPVIIAGGGASTEELQIFAHKTQIPVVTTLMGFYPNNDNNYIGMIGVCGDNAANNIIKESDLIIAVGTRFSDRNRKSFENDNSKKLIHIDINEKEISKAISATVGLVGDSKDILKEITEKTEQNNNTKWLEYAKDLIKTNIKPQKRTNVMHSFEVMEEIQKYIKDLKPIITTEVGQHQIWAARYLKQNSKSRYLTSGGLGTMGFGLPSAIGASIASGKEPVICIAGDGSVQMNIQEIATCMEYKLPIKIFVFNNGYLGMVRQYQEKSCEERYFATKISNPDFVKLAESYGATGTRVQKVEEIKPALDKAFSTDMPVIIDFIVENMEIL